MCLLFVFAFSIRLIGIDHGAHLGETGLQEAMLILQDPLGQLKGGASSLLTYMTALSFGGVYGTGMALNWWDSLEAFQAHSASNPELLHLTRRALIAATAAVMTPLSFGFANALGLSRNEAVAVALLVALAPVSIVLSYVYGPDLPFAAIAMWLAYLSLRKSQAPDRKRPDWVLGMALGLGLSINTAFAFLTVPLILAHLLVLLPQLGLRRFAGAMLRSVLACVAFWGLFNFSAFQGIQTLLPVLPTLVAELWAELTLPAVQYEHVIHQLGLRLVHWQTGLGILAPVAFVLFPLLVFSFKQPAVLMALWGGLVLGMFFLALGVAGDQSESLWAGYFVSVQLLSALSLVALTRFLRPVGAVFTLGSLLFALIGCVGIWQQTTARPLSFDVPLYLQAQQQGQSAVSNTQLQQVNNAEGAVRVLTSETLAAKPLAEWQAEGVTLFVISGLSDLRAAAPTPEQRSFFNDLAMRCKIVASFAPRKPLFLEKQTTVLECQSKQQVLKPKPST